MEVKVIECKLIDLPPIDKEIRSFNKKFGGRLAVSIKAVGLIIPILVRPNPDKPGRYILVGGRHRLYAIFNVLKEQTIAANILEEMTEEEHKMAAIADNLWRFEPNKVQRLEAISKWHEVYAAKHAALAAADAEKAAARVAKKALEDQSAARALAVDMSALASSEPHPEPAKPRASTPAPAPMATQPAPKQIQLPRDGRSAYAWAKNMERTFDTRIVQGMVADAKERGWSERIVNWNTDQIRTICLRVVAYLKTQSKYAGQFDHLAGEDFAAVIQPEPSKPMTPGVNVADLRKTLTTKMQALVHKQTGWAATTPELKAMFEEIAPQCQTSYGHTGVVPESLGKNTDATWIANMIQFVDEQIAYAMSIAATAENNEIPF